MKGNKYFFRQYAAILAFAVSAIVFLLAACNKSQAEEPPEEPVVGIITMTTMASEVHFYMEKLDAGDVIINWGDAEESIAYDVAFSQDNYYYANISHSYSGTSEHKITITGDIDGLYCADNQLTALDVSKNPLLRKLFCFENLLTELDVSRHPELFDLSCHYNQLTSLNVSGASSLYFFNCYNNQLTSLDVSSSIWLSDLFCENNQLTSLDMSSNIWLRRLNCSYNQLSTDALNDLFRTLPLTSNPIPLNLTRVHYASVFDNPGANYCDVSIANEKGWHVISE